MTFTAGQVLADVRDALQDDDIDLQRFTDATILGYLSDGLPEICVRRPDLFSQRDVLQLVAGAMQSAPLDSVRIIDVLREVGGGSLIECEKAALDADDPEWMSTTGTLLNWCRYVKDPARFFVANAAVGGEIVEILYARTPQRLMSLADVVPLGDAYRPALLHYAVFRAESKNDQSAVGGRAKLMWEAFNASLGASVESKVTTDGADNGPKTARSAR